MRRTCYGIFSSLALFALMSVAIAVAQTTANGPAAASAFTGPRLKFENGAGQLIVKGQPFLILGGELGNSAAGTAAETETIVPKLAAMHVNTILMPVAWEQIEPKEGAFDFSILDHWIAVSREHNMHLVLLWFGSWKNAFSNYAPLWVKNDAKRFPRAESIDGQPLEILSTFSAENRRCDARAFAALMRHVRQEDSEQQTVLMVQVENEVGYLGPGRNRSAEANRSFHSAVPDTLIHAFVDKPRMKYLWLGAMLAISMQSPALVRGSMRCRCM
jgi:beta-galactosidase GanA